MKKLSLILLIFFCFNLTNFTLQANDALVTSNECKNCKKFASPSFNTKDDVCNHLTGAWKGIVNASWLATLSYILLSPQPFMQDKVVYNTYIIGLGGAILTNWSLGSCWPTKKEEGASLIAGVVTLLGLSSYALYNNLFTSTEHSLMHKTFSGMWNLVH